MDRFCVINGQLASLETARIAPDDRGWSLADGCFETMNVVGGRIVWIDDHLARLAGGLAVLGIARPDLAELPANLGRLLAAQGQRDGVARLQVSRGAAQRAPARGIAPTSGIAPTTLLTLGPPVPLPERPPERSALIARRTCRNDRSPLSRIKAMANYPDAILALGEAAEGGADEALLLNTRGEVACGTVGNVWVVRGRRITTPPPEAGTTAGVMRKRLLAAADLGFTTVIAPLLPADLFAADEVLLTNVVRGVQAVTALDGRTIGGGAAGPAAAAILAWHRGQLAG